MDRIGQPSDSNSRLVLLLPRAPQVSSSATLRRQLARCFSSCTPCPRIPVVLVLSLRTHPFRTAPTPHWRRSTTVSFAAPFGAPSSMRQHHQQLAGRRCQCVRVDTRSKRRVSKRNVVRARNLPRGPAACRRGARARDVRSPAGTNHSLSCSHAPGGQLGLTRQVFSQARRFLNSEHLLEHTATCIAGQYSRYPASANDMARFAGNQ
jgi:hypothetical protein